MINSENHSKKQNNDQELYEVGQYGMYQILKELEKNKLYTRPVIIGLLDTLISAMFMKNGNNDSTVTVIGNITAFYLQQGKTKH